MSVVDGGRQIIVTGVVTAQNIGPPCNMKIVDGWWQNYASGDTLSFMDAKGRTFTYEPASTLQPVAIGKLDWVEGPLTVTTTGSATQKFYIVLGNK